jgi:hypothetical protein
MDIDIDMQEFIDSIDGLSEQDIFFYFNRIIRIYKCINVSMYQCTSKLSRC